MSKLTNWAIIWGRAGDRIGMFATGIATKETDSTAAIVHVQGGQGNKGNDIETKSGTGNKPVSHRLPTFMTAPHDSPVCTLKTSQNDQY